MRRNLLIAESLLRDLEHVNILLITGAREVAAFEFPAGIDAVTLPSLYKESNSAYRPRSFDFETAELIRIRSRIIKTSIEAFEPDIFIVDKVPRGTLSELEATLEHLRNNAATHCILGLRDVLDRPSVVKEEWQAAQNIEAIRRYYDAVWVYGDASVYDVSTSYQFPKHVCDKLTFTGYLNPSVRLDYSTPDERTRKLLRKLGHRFFICTVGGGQDGANLAEAFAQSTLPEGVQGMIVTGPHMPTDVTQRIQQRVDVHPHMHCERFLPEPLHLYKAAERFVAMGGYNTTLEILSLNTPALIVPRVLPREEQLIRGRILESLGIVDMLHPKDLSTDALEAWYSQQMYKTNSHTIDMDGLERICQAVMPLARKTDKKLSVQNKTKSHAIA